MAKWTAGNEAGDILGEFAGKGAMFNAMSDLLGIGGQFCAVSSQGAFCAYEITKYGYHATEKSVPDALRRDGRKH